MLVFRVLAFLWPFLKEMFLGDKTLTQAVKQRKGRVFIIAVIFASICLNFFAIPRLVEISHDYIELKKKYAEAKPVSEVKPLPVKPVVLVAEKSVSTAAPKPNTPPGLPPKRAPHDAYLATREHFERIRAREEKENKTLSQ